VLQEEEREEAKDIIPDTVLGSHPEVLQEEREEAKDIIPGTVLGSHPEVVQEEDEEREEAKAATINAGGVLALVAVAVCAVAATFVAYKYHSRNTAHVIDESTMEVEELC